MARSTWSSMGDEFSRDERALDGATILALPKSKKPKCKPLTITTITAIAGRLDLSQPLNSAVYACLTTTFYSAAQLGEFTIPSLKAFDPSQHVKLSDIRRDQDQHGHQVIVFHLPHTKSSPLGEDVYWSYQHGPSDPQAALHNHLTINYPPNNKALFSWRYPQGLRPFTHTEFLKQIKAVAAKLGMESLKGHGIHIRATLEYLLQGIPFNVVKSIGRWSSEAFLIYLGQHAIIIAPYIQGTPIMEAFTHYTMPPPH